MATYEYICIAGHSNIQTRPMTQEQTVFECELDNCSSELKRVYDAASVVFKGRGFYKTGG
jgi:predicted nucleic acid-binding Zn ribbon protein